jgi:hypothetical protein
MVLTELQSQLLKLNRSARLRISVEQNRHGRLSMTVLVLVLTL